MSEATPETQAGLETQEGTQQPVETLSAPVVESTPAPEPEQVYTYQPTDEHGRSLGGKQVIKYRTVEELQQKLTEQNILLIRKLRETTKKQRLGIREDEEVIPDTVQRLEGQLDFAPRQLSEDERVKLSRDLLDPDKFNEATSTLFEAALGAKPEQLRSTLSELQKSKLEIVCAVESDAFVRATPEYYRCHDNFLTLTSWMAKFNLYPSRDNFKLAYETLKAAGLLLEAPIVREEKPAEIPVEPTPQTVAEHTPANTQPVQAEPSRITTEEPAQPRRPAGRVPSGLTREQAADAGAARTVADEIVYEHIIRDTKGQPTGKRVFKGLAAIDAMPSDEFKRRINSERGFSAKYELLLKEQAQKRQ